MSTEANQETRVASRGSRRNPLFRGFFRKLDSHQKEIVSLLHQTTIFSDLTESELLDVMYLLHERVFAQGEVIFTEGEPGLGLYVIFKGEVVIGSRNEEKKERVAHLGAGEVFGEVSFLDGSGRSSTATAFTKTELIGFYRTELFDLLQRKPALASKILLAMARQLSLRLRGMLQMVQS